MVRGYHRILVLKQLEKGNCTGYDLMKALERRLGQRVSAGSMYPLLAGLEKEGLVRSTPQATENPRAKKEYKLTIKGKNHIRKLVAQKEALLRESVKLLRTLQYDGDKKRIENLVRLIEEAHKGERDLLPIVESWLKLKKAVISKLDKKDAKTEQQVRAVLAQATIKIQDIR